MEVCDTEEDEFDMEEFNSRVSKPTGMGLLVIGLTVLGFIGYGAYVFLIQVV